jgi:P-type Ca2+ transporter type 2C
VKAAQDGESKHTDLTNALTPDPGTEYMFDAKDNKFAYSPGQLSKMLNPKSLAAFHALGGIEGMQKGLQTNLDSGLSIDEKGVNGAVSFEDVAAKGAAPLGTTKDVSGAIADHPAPAPQNSDGGFTDRRRIFGENRLPDKKQKTIFELAWQTYNDKVLILLTIAAVVSLALGLYQTFGASHEEGGAQVEWVEGVAILVAIILVVVVGTVNDCK